MLERIIVDEPAGLLRAITPDVAIATRLVEP
jgi:hypothetical protein